MTGAETVIKSKSYLLYLLGLLYRRASHDPGSSTALALGKLMRGTYGSPAEHHQKSVLELTKERNRLGFRAIVIYYSAYTNVGHAKVPVGVIVVIYLFKRSHIYK